MAIKRTEHGMYKTRLYKIWVNMKSRCNNPNATHYYRYGGRGIKVCEEWSNSFVSFMEWAYNSGYNDNLKIDRIDFNGNYEPSNCRWVTHKKQMNNTSQNVFVTINGETKTLREWSKETGIDERLLGYRFRRGYKGKELLSKKPLNRHKKTTINGITKTLLEWSKETGIKDKTLYARFNKGWRGEKLIRPIMKNQHC